MKITDLIDVKPPQRGFRSFYEASVKDLIGGPTARGKTRDEAIENMLALIKEQVEHSAKRYYLMARDGTTFCLFWLNGWFYDIARHGDSVPSGVGLSTRSEKEARATMLAHWQQYNNDLPGSSLGNQNVATPGLIVTKETLQQVVCPACGKKLIWLGPPAEEEWQVATCCEVTYDSFIHSYAINVRD